MSNSFEAFVAATHPKSPSMTKEVTFGSGSVVSLRRSTGLPSLMASGQRISGCSGFGNGLDCMNPFCAFESTTVVPSRNGGPLRWEWFVFDLGRKPGKRAHVPGKMEVHDRSTPEVDRQSGRLAFEPNRPAAIRYILGRRYSQRDDQSQAR